MNLLIVPGMFACSRFPICVCMFIVSKVLLISSATVIDRAGGAIWLNLFAMVLFYVCSSVTVECGVLYLWVCLVCLLLFKEEGSSPMCLQFLRGMIWTCMKCSCLCLCRVLQWGLCQPTSICVVLCYSYEQF